MSTTKRQHFIPCCYLKYFSISGNWDRSRDTQIYFTDGTKSRIAAVKNLGVESYTYSKDNPEFDRQFHDMEGHYPQIIEKLLRGDSSLHVRDYYGLFMIMADFNLRNIAYENRTEIERRHVYEAISRSFNRDIYSEAEGGGTDMRAMMRWLETTWRVQKLIPETDEKFITSDNPSTIYSHPRTSRPVMLFLPAHPRLGIVAYDQRYLDMHTSKISDDALSVLNGLQINRSVRHTFSDHDLSSIPEEWKKVQGLVAMEKPARWADDERWNPDYISIASPAFDRLTFIRKINQKNILAKAVAQATKS